MPGTMFLYRLDGVTSMQKAADSPSAFSRLRSWPACVERARDDGMTGMQGNSLAQRLLKVAQLACMRERWNARDPWFRMV